MTGQPLFPQKSDSQIPRAFVIGWPIKHSRSPKIHSYWLEKMNLAGSYEKLAVEPDALDAFFASVKSGNFVGGNITLPHKEAAMNLVDQLDDAATRIGAVNTVWLEGDRLIGSNTDWIGFASNMDQCVSGWDSPDAIEKPAVILGAGGAARGVLYALRQRGFKEIWLVNRTIENARKLADAFGLGIVPMPIAQMNKIPTDISLFVNTTSLGMNEANAIPSEISKFIGMLQRDAIVSDIVYIPLETELLCLAKKNGLKTVDGLGMLLHQAVPGFEKWFGQRPQVDEALREILIADLKEKS